MSTVSVGAAGGAIAAAVRQVVERVDRQVISRATRGVNAIRNAELDVLKGQRGGRTYKKPGGGTYQASAPGEPPAVRSGALRQNWNGQVTGGMSGGGVAISLELISMETKYNDYMEHGTPGGMIAPRPYVDRITQKALPEVKAIYSEPYV